MTVEVSRISFSEKESKRYLVKTIFSSGAFHPTPRIFSSGIEGPCFIDLSIPLKDAAFVKLVTQGFKEIINKEELEVDAFCGVIRGGVPLAQLLAKELRVSWIARLGVKTDRERQRMIQGTLPSKSRVVIVDDIETTGLNATLAYQQIKEEGLNSNKVLFVMSYGLELAKRNLAKDRLVSHSLLNINDLVTFGLKTDLIPQSVALRINDWQQSLNSNQSSSLIAKP